MRGLTLCFIIVVVLVKHTVSYTMHNNQFSANLDKDFCKQSVFQGGEMVEMKADCEICSCKDDFCNNCV
jgi:hypothetical protein